MKFFENPWAISIASVALGFGLTFLSADFIVKALGGYTASEFDGKYGRFEANSGSLVKRDGSEQDCLNKGLFQIEGLGYVASIKKSSIWYHKKVDGDRVVHGRVICNQYKETNIRLLDVLIVIATRDESSQARAKEIMAVFDKSFPRIF